MPALRGHVSDTEPWLVGHNVILSHAHAAKLYKTEFQARQGGTIGITLNGDWAEPFDDSPESRSLPSDPQRSRDDTADRAW